MNGLKDKVTAIGVNSNGTIAAAANGPAQRVELLLDAKSAKYTRQVSGEDGPGEVVVWDMASGKIRTTFRDHIRPVTSIAISPDGAIVASASAKENVLRLWDSATGNKHITVEGRFGMLAFAPDGETLLARRATVAEDQSANKHVAINVKTSRFSMVVPNPEGRFRYHQFSPDARTFIRYGPKEVDSSESSIAQIVDVQTGKIEKVFEESRGLIGAVAWGPGPGRLTTASDQHNIRVWDIASCSVIRTHVYGESGFPRVWLSKDGRKLGYLSSDSHGDLQLCNVERLPVMGQ